MREFEDTWPAGLPRRTGVRRPDPRPFWTPILVVLIVLAALAAVLL